MPSFMVNSFGKLLCVFSAFGEMWRSNCLLSNCSRQNQLLPPWHPLHTPQSSSSQIAFWFGFLSVCPLQEPPEPFKATTVSYFPQSSLSRCVSPVNVCITKRSCAPYGKMRKAMDSKFICRACQSFIGLFLTKGHQADALSVSSTKLFPKSTQ